MVFNLLISFWWNDSSFFFIAGVTQSQVMGFSGLSRLLLMYIQVTIVILPIFILITTVRSISGDRDTHIFRFYSNK